MALPVRSELIANVTTLGARAARRLTGHLENRKLELRSTANRLPRLDTLLQTPRQRLDLAAQRFGGSLSRTVSRKRARFDKAAGGLRPDNVTQVIEMLHPWAVDVASGIESSRGIKSREKMIQFAKAVRSCDR